MTGRLSSDLRGLIGVCAIAILALAVLAGPLAAQSPRFEVVLPAGDAPVTGRLLVIAADSPVPEPRLTLAVTGPAVFGVDVEGAAPGSTITLSGDADSYPVSLAELESGEYHLQAVLVTYDTITRADGHTISVPITHRRIVFWSKPGNLYSRPVPARIEPGAVIGLELTEVIADLPELEDTEWYRRVRIRSDILSDFWGTDMYLGATVLVPRGFDDHPEARYPAIYTFGHGDSPFFLNPDPASHTEAAIERARDANVETGYEFYQRWIADDFPRVAAIVFEHPSPYFVESYAVNSANNGPYGDAITQELIPYLEREFRLIPERHARIVEGASTGGWEALAFQLYYPEMFGGAWVFNPDPIDFRRYMLADIYADTNMFTVPVSRYITRERPFRRTREGQPMWQMREVARFESVLGSRGRTGYQLGIWQATHGPVGEDGYPVALFDLLTGEINHEVAEYGRENGYDLTEYARRNWARLGPLLENDIHLIAGEMDEFYLNLAVYNFEDMILEVAGPDYPIRFLYGRPKRGHNYHHTDWAGMVLEAAEHIRANTPDPDQINAWNY